MALTILTTPLAGANTALRTITPDRALGSPALGASNTTWIYVGPATAAIAGAAVVVVSGAFAVVTGAGNYTADDPFAINEYGWVRKTVSPL